MTGTVSPVPPETLLRAAQAANKRDKDTSLEVAVLDVVNDEDFQSYDAVCARLQALIYFIKRHRTAIARHKLKEAALIEAAASAPLERFGEPAFEADRFLGTV
jgi:hypothetical protein